MVAKLNLSGIPPEEIDRWWKIRDIVLEKNYRSRGSSGYEIKELMEDAATMGLLKGLKKSTPAFSEAQKASYLFKCVRYEILTAYKLHKIKLNNTERVNNDILSLIADFSVLEDDELEDAQQDRSVEPVKTLRGIAYRKAWKNPVKGISSFRVKDRASALFATRWT